jgi:glycosyltransferase involved in cell wall biosynthesis
MPHISVVIPVYNERATIEEIVRRVQAVDLDKVIAHFAPRMRRVLTLQASP